MNITWTLVRLSWLVESLFYFVMSDSQRWARARFWHPENLKMLFCDWLDSTYKAMWHRRSICRHMSQYIYIDLLWPNLIDTEVIGNCDTYYKPVMNILNPREFPVSSSKPLSSGNALVLFLVIRTHFKRKQSTQDVRERNCFFFFFALIRSLCYTSRPSKNFLFPHWLIPIHERMSWTKFPFSKALKVRLRGHKSSLEDT